MAEDEISAENKLLDADFQVILEAGDMTDEIRLDDYPFRTSDKIRYGDTDRQGHVNNVVFAVYLELGRVEMLLAPSTPLIEPGSAFVIVRLALDFKAEINWPGEVEIGTRIAGYGRSSIRLEQALFQHTRCAAVAESVVVLMDEATRRSRPLSESAIAWLAAQASGA